MVQVYFLSVLLNFIGGAVLSASFWRRRLPLFAGIETFVHERSKLKLTLGILSLLVGVLKFLSATNGDIAVVGDMIPALGGIITGLTLLTVYYRGRSDVETETGFSNFLEKYQAFIGLLTMVSAVLHFFLPRVLFL